MLIYVKEWKGYDHTLFFKVRFTDQQLWSLGSCLGTVLPLPSPD